MAISIGDNFAYKGKKPNFERDSYKTLAALKSVLPTDIDDGHIAFCQETRLTYQFDSTSEANDITGYWKLFNGITAIQVDELDSDYQIDGNPSINFEIVYYIKIGNTVHNITGDSTIKWQNGESPIPEANSTIVISVLNNLAVWGIFK